MGAAARRPALRSRSPRARPERPACSRPCPRSRGRRPTRTPHPEALRHRRAQPARVEGAVRGVRLDAAPVERAGEDAHRAAHGVVAEEARGRPADDLDPLDGSERRLVPLDVAVDRVVQGNPVQEDERPVAAEAPHRDVVRRRLDRVAAPEREVQANDVPESVVERPARRVLDILARDHGHAHRDVRGRALAPGGGDDDGVGPDKYRVRLGWRGFLCRRLARPQCSEEAESRDPVARDREPPTRDPERGQRRQ